MWNWKVGRDQIKKGCENLKKEFWLLYLKGFRAPRKDLSREMI